MPLLPGDVIKTHPREGFWGCAVVLSAGMIEGLRPMCHIGVTPLVFQHDYVWSEIEGQQLSILEYDQPVRVEVMTYLPRHVTCIGIWVSDGKPKLPVIGRVDPATVYDKPLTFEVGDATSGKFPLCGKVDTHLGSEAVGAWHKLNDPVGFAKRQEESAADYERLRERLLEQERERRKRRRGGKK
jgi:hypothetical protein